MGRYRAEAITAAIFSAQAGDCVVIAGKGHEEYQIVGTEQLYFSDEQQANKALAERARS